MDLKKLKQHIQTLATVKETNSPMISCYLNLESRKNQETFERRVRLLQKSLTDQELLDFQAAANQIREYLRDKLNPESKGTAIFARGGDAPFFLPLQFRVSLPDWIAIGTSPNIYHLVELKDTYHRFVILIATEEKARILEVNLGEVTAQLLLERPELAERFGRGWSKEHYQNHRRNRTEQFIKEKIGILEKLMSAGGHTHLILAGNPRITSRVRDELPKHLAAKLVDTVVSSGNDRLSDVVTVAITAFVEQEEQESRAIVERLFDELHTNCLGSAGVESTLWSLQRGNVDILVMAKDFAPEMVWKCKKCQSVGIYHGKSETCAFCGGNKLEEIDLREEMIRLAEKQGCHTEVVNHSDRLMQFEGVGALLRFYAPEQY